jgi:drug/metabolite transporter (DMT)-like permease
VYIVSFLGRPRATARGDIDVAPGRGELLAGLALVAFVGLCWATATVWTRAVSEGASAVAVGAVRLPAAAVLVGCVVGFNGASTIRQRKVTRRGFGVLTIAGLAGTGLGSLLFLYALQEAGAGKAAVLSSASPLFALPLGALLLRERITAWVGLGTLLAVAGIVLMSA